MSSGCPTQAMCCAVSCIHFPFPFLLNCLFFSLTLIPSVCRLHPCCLGRISPSFPSPSFPLVHLLCVLRASLTFLHVCSAYFLKLEKLGLPFAHTLKAVSTRCLCVKGIQYTVGGVSVQNLCGFSPCSHLRSIGEHLYDLGLHNANTAWLWHVKVLLHVKQVTNSMALASF